MINKQKIKKLINEFERKHKEVFEEEGGDTDCNIVYNQMHRVASKKEWLGTEEEWLKAKKEQAEMDKHIRCYVCEFIENLNKN